MRAGWSPRALKEHNDAIRSADRLVILVGAVGLLALGASVVWGIGKATTVALEGERLARTVALEAANEKGVAHNGLIDRMREMQASYITKANVVLLLGLVLGWGTLAWMVWGRT